MPWVSTKESSFKSMKKTSNDGLMDKLKKGVGAIFSKN
jgi:hypothetical protein